MNGLCHAIHLNEDYIQQCWIQRYQAGNEYLAEERFFFLSNKYFL